MRPGIFDDVKGKKRLILEAAVKVFAVRGYGASNTREITEKAGVANGLLFYYFRDKAALFEEVVERCLDFLGNEFLIMDSERDFIMRMYHVMRIKLEQFAYYPDIYRLFLDSYFDRESVVGQKMVKMRADYMQKLMPHLLGANDEALFRDDIDPKLAKRVVMSALSGMGEEYIQAYQSGHLNIDQLMQLGMQDGMRYVDLLQKVLYKQPAQ